MASIARIVETPERGGTNAVNPSAWKRESETAWRRLDEILNGGELDLMGFAGGVAMTVVAVWMLLPWSWIGIEPVTTMWRLLPVWAWAVILLVVGVAQLVAVLTIAPGRDAREWTALASLGGWLILGINMTLNAPSAIFVPVVWMIILLEYNCYRRLRS